MITLRPSEDTGATSLKVKLHLEETTKSWQLRKARCVVIHYPKIITLHWRVKALSLKHVNGSFTNSLFTLHLLLTELLRKEYIAFTQTQENPEFKTISNHKILYMKDV